MVPQKLKELPNSPAISALDINPKDLKTELKEILVMQMLIAALFTVARRWKQHKYPSTDEQINKMWHKHTMEYHLAMKRNEGLTHAVGEM